MWKRALRCAVLILVLGALMMPSEVELDGKFEDFRPLVNFYFLKSMEQTREITVIPRINSTRMSSLTVFFAIFGGSWRIKCNKKICKWKLECIPQFLMLQILHMSWQVAQGSLDQYALPRMQQQAHLMFPGSKWLILMRQASLVKLISQQGMSV